MVRVVIGYVPDDCQVRGQTRTKRRESLAVELEARNSTGPRMQSISRKNQFTASAVY
ncbi:hypothetical protein P152DRAFT_456766 [Eremomyces bilateralis CBS 781.70]|uniref:Uncharacterized protein n=1 Tax=Eremomyces bilateralis CBS 781.70 TaxID=1392243 RepID=A0A6G1G9D2_9PEZI|nr:uncharacterized protein P152DRAFT_456766 [Eremomyces bilateralis CBS 781.70]KAF1814511.1 hypothetical protein P152DRAFT_456766 [Eremomyces bilateralis CBS 781.70]